MTKHQYREQFEDQVKDLVSQYLQTHNESPSVTIEWGKEKPEPVRHPGSEPPNNDRDVWVKLNDGRELRGWWYVNPVWVAWRVYYPDSISVFGEYPRPDHEVVEWWEISF